MAGHDDAGGILGLFELIHQHRGAVEYDWRTRFHIGLDDLPERMGWDEANRLARILAKDPSSHICAALEGWASPWSIEAHLITDFYDMAAARWSGNKAEPHKRPTDRRLPKPRPQREVIAALAARGHGRRAHG